MYSAKFQERRILETIRFMMQETDWSAMPEAERKVFFDLCQELIQYLPNFHWYDLVENRQQVDHLKSIKEKIKQFEKLSVEALK